MFVKSESYVSKLELHEWYKNARAQQLGRPFFPSLLNLYYRGLAAFYHLSFPTLYYQRLAAFCNVVVEQYAFSVELDISEEINVLV